LPGSQGGTESSVKIAKADLVPKDTNLREEYTSFAELETACQEFCDLLLRREVQDRLNQNRSPEQIARVRRRYSLG
jgi:hypothetical protein